MSEELVKTNTSLDVGGAGLDFSSKLFRLKPATLVINQGMTQVEGAVPGKLRVVETGEQFTKLTVAMLVMPKPWRGWYPGEKGKLNRVPENLQCFSTDMIRPDTRAKNPQALTCASCQYHSWNNTVTPAIPPECDEQYNAVFIDTETQLPLRMYIRGTSKKGFEAGMQNLARTFKLLQAKGQKPNIFDISFDILTEKHKTKGGQISHVLKIDGKSMHKVSEVEKAKFGEIYLNYVNYGNNLEDSESPDEVVESNKEIDQEVIDGEIVV